LQPVWAGPVRAARQAERCEICDEVETCLAESVV
jgi:hypothetical protein